MWGRATSGHARARVQSCCRGFRACQRLYRHACVQATPACARSERAVRSHACGCHSCVRGLHAGRSAVRHAMRADVVARRCSCARRFSAARGVRCARTCACVQPPRRQPSVLFARYKYCLHAGAKATSRQDVYSRTSVWGLKAQPQQQHIGGAWGWASGARMFPHCLQVTRALPCSLCWRSSMHAADSLSAMQAHTTQSLISSLFEAHMPCLSPCDASRQLMCSCSSAVWMQQAHQSCSKNPSRTSTQSEALTRTRDAPRAGVRRIAVTTIRQHALPTPGALYPRGKVG